MELVQATTEEHWNIASTFLLETVERCNRNNTPLWTHEQVTTESLKQSYDFEDLYLLQANNVHVGSVFISFGSDAFWPDEDTRNSTFFHKLAIGDKYHSRGLGHQALKAIQDLATAKKSEWLRCDCHGDRPRLRAFYERYGFELVDRKERFNFDVARYQISLDSHI